MKRARNEQLSLFECAAVVVALVMQLASLMTLLQEHAAR